MTSSVSSWRLQCGNNANQGNDLDEYTTSVATLGDVAITANGVYWLEQPDGDPWTVRYAARGALRSALTVYTAGVEVELTAIAASADLVAWLEYDRLNGGTIVTATATGFQLGPLPWYASAGPYKDVAVFGQRILFTNGEDVGELDVSGGNMPNLDYTAGYSVLQVAFDPTGERFALATDQFQSPWFAIHLQNEDGGPKVGGAIVDARAFAVTADAVFYLQAGPDAGLYRQAR
ncbi:MAG: hypothetical protein WKG00_11975 [Polyangiaceae bacterium]